MEEEDACTKDNFLEPDDIEEVIEVGSIGDSDIDSNSDSENDESETNKPLKDDAILTFEKHTKPVFCVAFHPEGKYCISGGKDDIAFVWNVETGESLLQMDTFTDSVVFVGFSFDGKYLAAADMAGAIQVRKCPHNNILTWDIVWQTDTEEIEWGLWHPAAHVLICSTKDGNIFLWKIPEGSTKVLYSHDSQATGGALFRDAKKMGVAYNDGYIKVWDLKTALPIIQIEPNADLSAMNAIDTFHDNNLLIAGDVSGNIYTIKSNDGKKIGVFNINGTPVVIKFSKDPSLGLVAIGTFEGEITIWDVARQTIRFKSSEAENAETLGIRSLLWINNYLLAACCNGTIRVIEAKSGQLVNILYGHKKEIFDMAYFSNSKKLVTASEDKLCKIFEFDLNMYS